MSKVFPEQGKCIIQFDICSAHSSQQFWGNNFIRKVILPKFGCFLETTLHYCSFQYNVISHWDQCKCNTILGSVQMQHNNAEKHGFLPLDNWTTQNPMISSNALRYMGIIVMQFGDSFWNQHLNLATWEANDTTFRTNFGINRTHSWAFTMFDFYLPLIIKK